ncbi:phage tail protein [Flavobacterium luteolum]|uniref:phage tail protein n=1 Tax=Flavobacterium luteolum TaxID=3003259 RepID=UPI00248E1629|nr:tail fiber protein [Flavobacterium luteolum]
MKKNYFLTFVLLFFTSFLFAQVDEYTGEIRLFAGTYAPNGWAFCDGSTLPISQYTALYSIIGTSYGGDGKTTFNLPDLRGRVPIGAGQSNSGSLYVVGQTGGREQITILPNEMPYHTHSASITVSNENASTTVPSSSSSIAVSGINSGRTFVANSGYSSGAGNIDIQTINTTPTGSGNPVKLSRPALGLNYIISLNATYPPRP